MKKVKFSLSLENRKNPFDGGVEVIVKTGHGKYFDVRSLSGGEQTLVALSLIFAIQELKHTHFIFLMKSMLHLTKETQDDLQDCFRNI